MLNLGGRSFEKGAFDPPTGRVVQGRKPQIIASLLLAAMALSVPIKAAGQSLNAAFTPRDSRKTTEIATIQTTQGRGGNARLMAEKREGQLKRTEEAIKGGAVVTQTADGYEVTIPSGFKETLKKQAQNPSKQEPRGAATKKSSQNPAP